jgi:hypothetical protein
VTREYRKERQHELLADITAMTTLALHGDRDELERYVGNLPYDETDIRFLLQSAVILYGEAFTRLGKEQGFDPHVLTRQVALREAAERWRTA